MSWKIPSFLAVPMSLVGASQAAFAQQTSPPATPPPWSPMPGPWHMWAGGYGWHAWWWMPLTMLVLGLVAVAVAYFVFGCAMHHTRRPWQTDQDGSPTRSALQILNERFARGEIQKPEYEDRKSALLGR